MYSRRWRQPQCIEHVMPNGEIVRTWRWPVPRVPDELFTSIVFIYPSDRDAREDTRFGGTGFLVAVPGVEETDWYSHEARPVSIYVVTAAHVVVGKGERVLRINDGETGSVYLIPVAEGQWVWQADDKGLPKNDLAVLPIDLPMKFVVGPWPLWITYAYRQVSVSPAGPGDDVVMIGRFVDRGGKSRNLPALRFGNISMVADADEPVTLERGQVVDAFLVEMRSRGGHSGSPVYTFEEDFMAPAVRSSRDLDRLRVHGGLTPPHKPPRLLGIDQGQFPTYLELVDDQGRRIPGQRVKERSAVSVVIPSWHLVDLLFDERLVEMRQKRKNEAPESPRPLEERPDEESAEEDRPLMRRDFEDTLRRVTRRVNEPPEDPKRR